MFTSTEKAVACSTKQNCLYKLVSDVLSLMGHSFEVACVVFPKAFWPLSHSSLDDGDQFSWR